MRVELGGGDGEREGGGREREGGRGGEREASGTQREREGERVRGFRVMVHHRDRDDLILGRTRGSAAM